MKMAIYGISLKGFILLMMIFGFIIGMFVAVSWPNEAAVFVYSIRGFLAAILKFLLEGTTL